MRVVASHSSLLRGSFFELIRTRGSTNENGWCKYSGSWVLRVTSRLVPAFTSECGDWHLGICPQLQQRNCSRFARDSLLQSMVIQIAKNCRETNERIHRMAIHFFTWGYSPGWRAELCDASPTRARGTPPSRSEEGSRELAPPDPIHFIQ
jgi:hypothetical protein